jgi:hypothetical protein
MSRTSIARLACVATLLAAGSAFATTPDTSAVSYGLITPPSALESGCQGPCECAVVTQPTYGSLTLAYVRTEAGYAIYDVRGYIASFNNGPGAVSIVGSGQYRISTGLPAQQQMTLDLQVWGQPEHFDSGLKPVQTPFPRIEIACAVHGFACVDSVLEVDARPLDTAGAPGTPARATGLQAVLPNPFSHGARIVFTLAREGPVDLAVLDVTGRRVCAIASQRAMPAGQAVLAWDGRRDDGAVAPAGTYWVRMRWPGGEDRRRIVKLDGAAAAR